TRAGYIPGGTTRNVEDGAAYTTWSDDVADDLRVLLCDAQTSGGLLIALPADRAAALVERLRALDSPSATVVGELVAQDGGRITVRNPA
ncbi:MAG TPA: selenide, water dikinase SelD, partial [Longimicrobiales bacterium]|nr:selenide, water dikinase SelD [Longimicrobiales bacterium]